jgi:AraC-like DNA-binding protein
MFGGYRIAGEDINPLEYAMNLGIDPTLLCQLYESVNVLTREEVDASVELLKLCIEHILAQDLVCVPTYERAEQVKVYIDTHTSTPMTIDSLCAELFISRRHLQKIFKDAYGITVKQYILDKQLALAEHLLITTDMTIAEVALASGFSDYNNFIQRFKQSRGITPLQFRKSHRS